uniref:Uncharacterized protein n=1 Tax=Anguilla anguilla TaxID=7936 RepID=A0A0E9TNG6_ANGAN
MALSYIFQIIPT